MRVRYRNGRVVDLPDSVAAGLVRSKGNGITAYTAPAAPAPAPEAPTEDTPAPHKPTPRKRAPRKPKD